MQPRRLPALALLLAAAGLAFAPALPAAAASPSPSEAPSSLMLLLDSSGSMAEPADGGVSKIEAAREALGATIDGLPDDLEVGLRVYGSEVESLDQPGACEDSRRVVDLGTGNRDALREAVAAYEPFGETPIGFALRAAADDLGDEGERAIVLVSDGIATCEPDPCVVAAELAAAGFDLRIDVVGLGVDAEARAQLRCIAAEGNGEYYDASSADEIVDSLTTAAERAIEPFVIDGEPVQGSLEAASAPVLRAGRYVDDREPGVDEPTRWYRFERSIPGSTVFVTVYEMVPGSEGSLYPTVTSMDGESCDGGPNPTIHDVFTGYTRVVDPGAGAGCDGSLLVELDFLGSSEVSEFGLSFVEEPPVRNAADLPAPVAEPDPEAVTLSAETEPITPGSQFSDAALLEPGQTYSATIVPGEVQAMRVQVDWGQQLVVRVDHPGLTDDQRDVLPTFTPTQLQILNPLRSSVWDVAEEDDLPSSATLSRQPSTNYVSTAPVTWRNRESDTGSAAYLAGEYFIAYQADFDSPASVELPYTITVEVQGEPTGAPEYADGAEVLFAAPEASPTPEASAVAAEEPGDERGEGLGPVPFVVGGLVVLLGGVLAWWLLRRRRTGARE